MGSLEVICSPKMGGDSQGPLGSTVITSDFMPLGISTFLVTPGF